MGSCPWAHGSTVGPGDLFVEGLVAMITLRVREGTWVRVALFRYCSPLRTAFDGFLFSGVDRITQNADFDDVNRGRMQTGYVYVMPGRYMT